jgi:hypothetical protein
MINYAGKNKLGSDDDQVETAEDLKRGMTNEEWETVYNMTKVSIIFPAFSLQFSVSGTNLSPRTSHQIIKLYICSKERAGCHL